MREQICSPVVRINDSVINNVTEATCRYLRGRINPSEAQVTIEGALPALIEMLADLYRDKAPLTLTVGYECCDDMVITELSPAYLGTGIQITVEMESNKEWKAIRK